MMGKIRDTRGGNDAELRMLRWKGLRGVSVAKE